MNSFLTRLRLSALRIQSAWPYMFAHKPLCDRHRGETIRLGNMYLCRSCTLLWGSFLMIMVLWVISRNHGIWSESMSLISLISLSVCGMTILFSAPGMYRRWGRGLRDILRSMLGISVSLGLVLILSGNYMIGLMVLGMLGIARVWYMRGRETHSINSCEGCPEYCPDKPRVCSGYRLQADRFLEFESRASEILSRSRWTGGR